MGEDVEVIICIIPKDLLKILLFKVSISLTICSNSIKSD